MKDLLDDIFFIVNAYRRFSCDGGKAAVSIIYYTKLRRIKNKKSAQAGGIGWFC
jgi:hypothetical protein